MIDSLIATDVRNNLVGQGYAVSPIARLPEAANGMFIRGHVSGDQAVHTATDIPLSAYSTGTRASAQFTGVMDNTDVFILLTRAALGGY